MVRSSITSLAASLVSLITVTTAANNAFNFPAPTSGQSFRDGDTITVSWNTTYPKPVLQLYCHDLTYPLVNVSLAQGTKTYPLVLNVGPEPNCYLQIHDAECGCGASFGTGIFSIGAGAATTQTWTAPHIYSSTAAPYPVVTAYSTTHITLVSCGPEVASCPAHSTHVTSSVIPVLQTLSQPLTTTPVTLGFASTAAVAPGSTPIPFWSPCGPTVGTNCAPGSQCICKDQYYSQCRPIVNGQWTPPGETWQCTAPGQLPQASPAVGAGAQAGAGVVASPNPVVASPVVSASPVPAAGGASIPFWSPCGATVGTNCAPGSQCICKDQYYAQCRPLINGSWTPQGETWQCTAPGQLPQASPAVGAGAQAGAGVVASTTPIVASPAVPLSSPIVASPAIPVSSGPAVPAASGATIPYWSPCGSSVGTNCADGSQCICKDQYYAQCRPLINGSWTPQGETWLCSGPGSFLPPSTAAGANAQASAASATQAAISAIQSNAGEGSINTAGPMVTSTAFVGVSSAVSVAVSAGVSAGLSLGAAGGAMAQVASGIVAAVSAGCTAAASQSVGPGALATASAQVNDGINAGVNAGIAGAAAAGITIGAGAAAQVSQGLISGISVGVNAGINSGVSYGVSAGASAGATVVVQGSPTVVYSTQVIAQTISGSLYTSTLSASSYTSTLSGQAATNANAVISAVAAASANIVANGGGSMVTITTSSSTMQAAAATTSRTTSSTSSR